MKRIVFYLTIAVLSVFCFVKARAQGNCVSNFGTTKDTCWSKTAGYLWMPVYGTNDSNKVFGVDAEGKVVLRTKSNSSSTEDTPITIPRIILMGQSNAGGVGDSSELYNTEFAGQKFNYIDTIKRVYLPNLANGDYRPYVLGVTTIQYAAGQLGSDLGLAQRWVENTHQGNLYIHKRVRDGGAISLFQKGTSTYTDLINILDSADRKLAEQGYKAENIAFIWVQGESDKTATEAQYLAALNQLVDSLKSDDVIQPDTRMVISGISTGSKMYGAGVRAAQEAFVAANPLARFINTDDLTFNADTLHYDTKGLLNLGYRCYQAIFNDTGKSTTDIKNVQTGSLIVGLGNQDAVPDRALLTANAPTHLNDTVVVENLALPVTNGTYHSGILLNKKAPGTLTGIMHNGNAKMGLWFDDAGPYLWFCDNRLRGASSVRADTFGNLLIGANNSMVGQLEITGKNTDTNTWRIIAIADVANSPLYYMREDGVTRQYKRAQFDDAVTVGSLSSNGAITGTTSIRANGAGSDYGEFFFSGGNPGIMLFNSGLSGATIVNNGTALATNIGLSVGGNLTSTGTATFTSGGLISGNIGGTATAGSVRLWGATDSWIEYADNGAATWWHVGTEASPSGDIVYKSDPASSATFNGTEKLRIARTTGKLTLYNTVTPTGTTGNQTINRPTGSVNIAAGGTAVTVTNSTVTSSSLVFAELQTNDATATIKNVVPTTGSFTINLGAAATGEVKIAFWVIN